MDGATTAERAAPLVGVRVSWGAILSGTLVTLAVIAILGMLGLAITLIAMEPEQWSGATVALWIIRISVTLIGASLGGLAAGWFMGSGIRRLGALHGFLSGALAFLISLMVWSTILAGLTRFVTTTAVTATTAAVGATAQAARGVVAGGGSVADNMSRFLQGLGYGAAEADQMVREAQRSVQRAVRGRDVPTGPQAAERAGAALDQLLAYFGGALIIYWATWIVALLLAMISGGIGAKLAGRRPFGQPSAAPSPTPPYTPPLTPREA